jgi:hypothetical protein
VRYLGVLFAHEGCGDGEGRWREQRLVVDASVRAFFGRCALIHPTLRQYVQLVHTVLVAKVLYPWRVMPPPATQLTEVRAQIVRRAAATLRIGPLGGGAGAESADAELLLTPSDMMGFGVPDVAARLAAALAVDVLTLLETSAPVGRHAAEIGLCADSEFESAAATLDLLRRSAGLELHAGSQAPRPLRGEEAPRVLPRPQQEPNRRAARGVPSTWTRSPTSRSGLKGSPSARCDRSGRHGRR